MGSDDIAKKRISANKERRNSQKETRKARNVGNRSIIPVKEHFKKTYAPEYSETNTDIIEALASQYNHAIHNSIRLYEQQVQVNSNNPITNIHSLVLLLKNISDRTQNYSFDEQYQCFIETHI